MVPSKMTQRRKKKQDPISRSNGIEGGEKRTCILEVKEASKPGPLESQ